MKVKVDVSQLKKGMYVSELDRSWTETSFLLQGVLIENEEEIAEFQKTCEHVFIDADKSDESIYAHLRSLTTLGQDSKSINNSAAHESHEAELEQNNFQKELKVARKLHTRTRTYIDKALDDVRLG